MGFLAHFFVGVDRTRQIADLIEPTLNEMGFELVRVLVTGGQRPTLQIMVDRADLAPLTVAHCAEASHAISALLDVADHIGVPWRVKTDERITWAADWLSIRDFEPTMALELRLTAAEQD